MGQCDVFVVPLEPGVDIRCVQIALPDAELVAAKPRPEVRYGVVGGPFE